MKKDYVFIDTSVFMKNQYFKEGGLVSRFLELAEKGNITILMPEIIKAEWQKHFIEDGASISIDISKRLSLTGIKDKTTTFLLEAEKAINDYNANKLPMYFHQQLNRKGIETVGYDYCDGTVQKVFEKYFAKEKPFGTKGKKDEFPDAFILASLEKYAETNKIPQIIVLSADPDISEYKNPTLVYCDAKIYLDKLNREIAELNNKEETDVKAFTSYMSAQGPKDMQQKVTGLVLQYLENPDNYSYRFGFYDIEEVYEPQVDITIDGGHLKILQIDDNYIKAECAVFIKGSVIVNHFDEDESIWDSEDKKYIFEKYSDTKISINSNVTLSLIYVRNELEMGQVHEVKLKSIDFSDLEEFLTDGYYPYNFPYVLEIMDDDGDIVERDLIKSPRKP